MNPEVKGLVIGISSHGGAGVPAWPGRSLAMALLLSAVLGLTSQNPWLPPQGAIPFGITFFYSPSSQITFFFSAND